MQPNIHRGCEWTRVEHIGVYDLRATACRKKPPLSVLHRTRMFPASNDLAILPRWDFGCSSGNQRSLIVADVVAVIRAMLATTREKDQRDFKRTLVFTVRETTLMSSPRRSFSHVPPARLAAATSLALGAFGVLFAWLGAASCRGDLAIVVSAAVSLMQPWIASRCTSTRSTAVLVLTISLVLGALLGLAVMGAPRVPLERWFVASGVVLWFALAVVRAVCALPLTSLLRTGASLAARDAIDRAMLGASLWLLAALIESTLVVRLARPVFDGLAAPLLGVALFSLMVLSGLSAFVGVLRGLRWLWLWHRVTRAVGWRIESHTSSVAVDVVEAWFEDLGANTAIAMRTVVRDGPAYREGALEVAVARVPADVSQVTRGLARRLVFAAMLMTTWFATSMALVAPLRW
jgi:hypothetical protein